MTTSLTRTLKTSRSLIQVWAVCLLLQSCLTGEQSPTIADCQKGWSFNTVARKCEKFVMPPAAPLAVSEVFSIREDSGENFLELGYEDDNADLASVCTIHQYSENLDGNGTYMPVCECKGGRCFVTVWPDFDFYGEAQFTYSVTDRHGQSNIQLATVDVESVEDSPVAEMDNMDEEILNIALIDDGVTIEDNFGVIEYNSYIEEGESKTIYLWGEDYDFDPVSACQVTNISDHLEVNSLCTCEEDLFGIGSLCQVNVIARTNFYGNGEFITYQVYASGEWSEAETHFLEIRSVNDPPVICHYSLYAEAPECAKDDDNDNCVGTEKPTTALINPTSHNDTKPVWFLDEEKGECFRSVDLGSVYYWLGHLEDPTNYGDDDNGGIVNSDGDLIEYPYGAEWITIDEGSSLNVINLQDAIDIDHRYDEADANGDEDDITSLSYYTYDLPTRGKLRNCLSNNNHGDQEYEEFGDEEYRELRTDDLSCVYDIKYPNEHYNLNNNYIYDTIAVGNAQNSPSLRFVAKQSGDLATEHSSGRLCIKYVEGNTNGAASVSVDTAYDDGIETSYCENFPFQDGFDSSGFYVQFYAEEDSCEEYGIHAIELNSTDGVPGEDLYIRINANVDNLNQEGADRDDTVDESFLLKFNEENFNDDDLSTDDITLEVNVDGVYADGYGVNSITVNDLIEYQVLTNEDEVMTLYIRNLTKNKHDAEVDVFTDAGELTSYDSSKVQELNPFWRYDCGDDNGGTGRLITVTIDDENTTSQTIKEAIEAHSTASSLVDVYMYGSLREEVTAQGEENAWPKTLGGGREYLDYFSYVAEDTYVEFNGETSQYETLHSESNLGRVYISINPKNDTPVISTNGVQDLGSISAEDGPVEIELDIASDADYMDNLSYYISDLPENGTLSGCANLEGSDGPADITCIFTPDANYNGEINIVYYAEDESGAITSSKEIEFDINASNDNPVVCQYTIFEKANECGVSDCIHSMTPVGRIIPKSHTDEAPVYFYQKDKAVCFKSTGDSSADDWEEVTEHIADIYVNQSQDIRLTNIRVDEGGSGDEDSQELVLTNVEISGDTNLVDISDIKFIHDDSDEEVADGTTTWTTWTFGDASESEDMHDLIIEITPNNSEYGTATITLTFNDGGETITTSFNLVVYASQLVHEGWKNIKALGPRLAGSPYCDDNGQREQTIIDFSGAAVEENNTITLHYNSSGSSEVFTFKDSPNDSKHIQRVDGNNLENVKNAAAKINDNSYFDAWAVSEVLYIQAINSGNLTDSSTASGTLKIKDGINTTTGNRDSCIDGGGTWRAGEIVQDPNVCSFSRTKCDDGDQCHGSVAPDNVVPDEFNAIYRYDNTSTTHSCYRARAQRSVNNLTFTSKLAGAIVIEMKLDGTEGSEWVEVLDQNADCDEDESNDTFYKNNPAGIVHYMRIHAHELSDNDDLAERIIGDGDMDCNDGDASCLVDVTYTNAGHAHGISEGQYFFGVNGFSYYNVGDILLVGFGDGLSVEFRDNDSADATVSFVDKKLLVAMDSKDSNRCAVVDAINKHSDAREYLVAIDLGNQNAGEEEDEDEEGEVITLSTSNFSTTSGYPYWESFETHCNISESELMPSCRDNYLLGASCIGYINPNEINDGNATFTRDELRLDARFSASQIIPLEFNQFYQDLNSRTCYRSDVVDLTPDSNGDGAYGDADDVAQFRFVEYVATGTTTLSWEDFSLSDGQVITGYEVYRKLGAVMENVVDVVDDSDPGSPAVSDGVVDGLLTDLLNDNIKTFDWDYTAPVNIATLASSVKSFTDDPTTSRHPPVPGTVYFYEVRPIVNNVVSKAQEDHRRVRIMSPPENFAFVHRWMVNKKICDMMHADTRQDVENPEDYAKLGMDDYFSCLYYGPGTTETAIRDIDGDGIYDNESFYDIGHDMIVMQTEAGCPYTRNGCEGGAIYDDGNCIGKGDPDGVVTPKNDGAEETVYYDREGGECYVYEGSWDPYAPSSANDENIIFTNSLNPPLVNLVNTSSRNACYYNLLNIINTNTLGVVTVDIADDAVDSTPLDIDPAGSNFSQVKGGFFGDDNKLQHGALPNRDEQIAYSLWDVDELSDSEINTLETGLSLNSSSKCNSSDASGLEDGYTDTESPGVNYGFSMPGTYSSEIRSVQTGSDVTQACQSVFGIQDAIGNVSEFSGNTMVALTVPTFLRYTKQNGLAATNMIFGDPVQFYYMDDIFDQVGPCPDDDDNGNCWLNADGTTKENLDSWVIDTEAYDSNHIFIPYGLPVVNDYATGLSEPESAFTFEIGPTSGITSEQLHDDEWIFNTDENINNSVGKVDAFFTGGGSYEHGSGAGVWFMEWLNPTDARSDVGFRCIYRVYEENYFENQMGSGALNH